jgi:hypothetical protein
MIVPATGVQHNVNAVLVGVTLYIGLSAIGGAVGIAATIQVRWEMFGRRKVQGSIAQSLAQAPRTRYELPTVEKISTASLSPSLINLKRPAPAAHQAGTHRFGRLGQPSAAENPTPTPGARRKKSIGKKQNSSTIRCRSPASMKKKTMTAIWSASSYQASCARTSLERRALSALITY